VIEMRDTLLSRLGFVALALVSLVATLGLVLIIAHQSDQQIASRLAQAEMVNVKAKIEGLSDQKLVVEISNLVASRHLSSQIARGADIANGTNAQVASTTACTTPLRDQRIISAAFAADQLPGEPETRFAGTPLDWSKVKLNSGDSYQIAIPIGAACNLQLASAQIVVAHIGKTMVVTGWMTEPLSQLAIRYWKPASFAFGTFLILGICVAFLTERRARTQMRHLTAVLRQVGEGNFDAAPLTGTRDSEYRQLSVAISSMAQQLKGLHAGLSSLMDRTAHDLRTPLARAIARINNVMSVQSDPADIAQLANVEADLRDLSGRFGAMLSLREAATLDPDLGEPINLAEIAELAAALYQDLDIGQDKNVTLDLAPAWIRAQRGLIQNAVANLLDNALRFAPRGGRVDISTTTQNNTAILSITDNGPGLDPNQACNIFEAGVTTRSEEGGYGLGLATVREVARRYGGTITLVNRATQNGHDSGAKATLSLPSPPPF
jgi:signal transduction histidine kinase